MCLHGVKRISVIPVFLRLRDLHGLLILPEEWPTHRIPRRSPRPEVSLVVSPKCTRVEQNDLVCLEIKHHVAGPDIRVDETWLDIPTFSLQWP